MPTDDTMMQEDVKPSVTMTLDHFPSSQVPELLSAREEQDASLRATNNATISLFSPWQALYSSVNPFFTPQVGGHGNTAATLSFPSPSLGITIGDTFVPWPDLSAFNGATPGPGGMSTGITPASTGFPFPHQPTQLKQDRKDSLAAAERQAPSRIDSTSSGGSTSAVSATLQTPEANSALNTNQNSGASQQQPPQQVFQQFQPQIHNFGVGSYGFPTNGPYSAQVNTFPPSANNATQLTSAAPGWHPYNGFTNQFYAPPPLMGSSYQAGPASAEAPLVSRTSSTSTHHSAISPAMLSNTMPSRMPNQPSAFGHLPDEEDALAVISSAAPSEYGGQGMSSRGPSPEIMKKDRKRRSSGPHTARRPGGEVDVASDAGSGEEEDAEGEAEPEGVERNGMMWGMKTEVYKALSARERKRVRNRISARTFRARRKEHLNVLESDLADRNTLIKASQDEIRRLREENEELRHRLSKYERVG